MRYFTFLLLLAGFTLNAQTDLGLVTSYSFNGVGCPSQDDNGDPNVQELLNGTSCACGVEGGALYFDGDDDRLIIFGQKIDETFAAVDFTLSFYFKPTLANTAEPQVLFSKKSMCETDSSFMVSFIPGNERLIVDLVETTAQSGSLFYDLDKNSCWYHVAVIRQGGTTILYVNGEEVRRVTSFDSQRVNISNPELFSIGSNDCSTDGDFDGFIDEIRLYNRALSRDEVEDLYFAPDQINVSVNNAGVKETTILLGNSVQIDLNNTCAEDFQWTPTNGVSNDMIAEPLITPTETTTYAIELSDSTNCIAYDSVRIVVVDPTTISCTDILLPSAFTPNGDGLNDEFGISNPFSTGELLAFEIFDRWGNIVYASQDVLSRWDGTYKGTVVAPGVFLYKIHFRCEGKEDVKSGSLTVIR